MSIDAHWTTRSSVDKTKIMNVSQAHDCSVRFTIEPQTSSGEHKFKLIEIVVTGM